MKRITRELIAKPPGNIARLCAIPEKCGSDAHLSGKAGGFAISSRNRPGKSKNTTGFTCKPNKKQQFSLEATCGFSKP